MVILTPNTRTLQPRNFACNLSPFPACPPRAADNAERIIKQPINVNRHETARHDRRDPYHS